MESKFIRDEMVTSSGNDGNPANGRLNHGSFWSTKDKGPWLQVDFIMIAIVIGISTQGKLG